MLGPPGLERLLPRLSWRLRRTEGRPRCGTERSSPTTVAMPQKVSSMPDLIHPLDVPRTIPGLAKFLGDELGPEHSHSTDKLYRWVREGRLPARRSGRAVHTTGRAYLQALSPTFEVGR